MMHRLWVVGLACLPCLLSAETPPTLDEVITISKRVDNRFDNTGNIAKLAQDELQNIAALHIQDALVRVPGVNLQQGNGQEYLPAIRSPVLTGAGACGSFLVAQDNIPLRAAGFCNINELFEAYTEGAQQIEVIRGPGNALYGSNALHGVINVILPSVPQQTEGRLSLEAGANDYRREQLQYGTRMGEHGLLFNATTTHDGGFREEAYYDQQKMQLRHEMPVGDWQVATTFAATNLNQETAGYISTLDRHSIELNEDPEAYRDVQSFRLYSRWARELGDNLITVTPYARKTSMDFRMHFLPGTPLEENGQESVGTQLTYYFSASDQMEIITGLDLETTEGYLKETQTAPTFASFPTGKHYDYQVDALQVAPYGQIDWQLTERLTLTAGLRYELMAYNYDNRMRDGNTAADGGGCPSGTCRFSRPADREDRFRNWSPKLGVRFAVNDNLNLYSTLAHGFRAPQTPELYRLQGNQQVTNLKSEEITSLEVGVRGRTQYWWYEANVYRMEKQEVIFQDSNRFTLSGGETQHFGVELDVRYQFNDYWDFALAANYGDHYYSDGFTAAGIDIEGNQADTAPKRFGSAQLGLQLSDNARAELEFVHMGAYYTDITNENRYGGHDLINLRAYWQPLPTLKISLRMLNVSDELYATRADFAFGNDRYFPGEPRSLYAGIEYQF